MAGHGAYFLVFAFFDHPVEIDRQHGRAQPPGRHDIVGEMGDAVPTDPSVPAGSAVYGVPTNSRTVAFFGAGVWAEAESPTEMVANRATRHLVRFI